MYGGFTCPFTSYSSKPMRREGLSEHHYNLSDHEFVASPKMDAMYVINTETTVEQPLPRIVAVYSMEEFQDPDGLDTSGISLRLELVEGVPCILIRRGNIFSGDILHTVRNGHVVVEREGYHEGATVKRVEAFLASATIDKLKMVVTAGGIGISDILSGDPLLVDLVSAPLDVLKNAAGEVRTVHGIHIAYVDFDSGNYTQGPYTAKVWGFHTYLEPNGAL